MDAKSVHNNYRGGFLRDMRFDGCSADTPVAADVTVHGDRANLQNCVKHGFANVTRQNDFVIQTYPNSTKGQAQRFLAAPSYTRHRSTNVLFASTLELVAERTSSYQPTFHNIGNNGFVIRC